MFRPHRFGLKTAAAAAFAVHGLGAQATTPSVVEDIKIRGLWEGQSAKVREINFICNEALATGIVHDETTQSAPTSLSLDTKNDLYSEKQLKQSSENIHSCNPSCGDFEFNNEPRHVAIPPGRPGSGGSLTEHAGEPLIVSFVTLAGKVHGLGAELRKLVMIEPGDHFSVEKLNVATKAIVDKLGEYGYAFATVTLQQQCDRAAHKVGLTLVIDAHQRVYVRRINISGNTRTRDEVIRREMLQLESSWLDSSKLARSKNRINRLGYFASVDVMTVPVKGAPDEVDVDVRVTERPAGALTFGSGLSSTDELVLSAGLSMGNEFGSGTSFAVNASTAKSYRTLMVTQVDPYFTVDGIKRITDVYYRTNQPLYYSARSSVRIITAGSGLTFDIPFSALDRVYFGFDFEQTRLDVDSAAPRSFQEFVNEFGRASSMVPFTLGWSRDARDSALVPRTGYFAQAVAEVDAPVGEIHYYKMDVRAQYYYSVTRSLVLGLNLRAGYGKGVGNAYPIFKNYYGGGIGSVRGYASHSLGPRDTQTGDPIGGSKTVVGSIELGFPLPNARHDDTMRLFTFLDGGNVWGDAGGGASTDANGLRYGYGVGLTWVAPIGPLALSLGFPLRRHEGDQYQKFQFQFVAAF